VALRVFEAPWPQPWLWRRWALWLGPVLFLPLAVVGLYVAATDPEQRLLGSGLGLGSLVLAGPGLVQVTSRRGTAQGVRLSDGGPGLELPPRTWAAVVMLSSQLGLLALGAALLISALEGRVRAPTSVVAGVVGVVIAVTAVLRGRRGATGPGGPPRLTLDPDGVELRGWLGSRRITWEAWPVPVPYLYGQTHFHTGDYLLDYQQSRRTRLGWWFRRHVVLVGGMLDVDHAAAAAAVIFYRDHPEHRAELTSVAGVERIRLGDLPAPWPEDT